MQATEDLEESSVRAKKISELRHRLQQEKQSSRGQGLSWCDFDRWTVPVKEVGLHKRRGDRLQVTCRELIRFWCWEQGGYELAETPDGLPLRYAATLDQAVEITKQLCS